MGRPPQRDRPVYLLCVPPQGRRFDRDGLLAVSGVLIKPKGSLPSRAFISLPERQGTKLGPQTTGPRLGPFTIQRVRSSKTAQGPVPVGDADRTHRGKLVWAAIPRGGLALPCTALMGQRRTRPLCHLGPPGLIVGGIDRRHGFKLCNGLSRACTSLRHANIPFRMSPHRPAAWATSIKIDGIRDAQRVGMRRNWGTVAGGETLPLCFLGL